ncbi:hypothetical protein DPMN_085402, partial [Dreissena polymorpha]
WIYVAAGRSASHYAKCKTRAPQSADKGSDAEKHGDDYRKHVLHASAVPRQQPMPAFMATLTSTNLPYAVNAPLIFDRELLATRNAYDIRHGIFRAPVNGTYIFFATLTAKPGDVFQTTIVKNFPTEDIGLLFSTTGQSGWSHDSTAIVVQLAAGDDVWLACYAQSTITGGNNVEVDNFFSYFSGLLLDAY